MTTAAGSPSGFQLTLPVLGRNRSSTRIFLIAAGQSTSVGMPPLRVMLVVTLNGTPQPLFDGVMTNVEVQAGSGGSPGTVTVTGEDLTQGDGHAWTSAACRSRPCRSRRAWR